MAAGYESAEQAASQLGIEPHTYRAYERGAREAKYETLVRMCELFKVSTAFVLPVHVSTPSSNSHPMAKAG